IRQAGSARISATWRTFAVRAPGENHGSFRSASCTSDLAGTGVRREVKQMDTGSTSSGRIAEAARTFGDELRCWRGRAGLTQRELAERVRYSRETVAAVERGRRYATHELALRCDEVLGTDGVLGRLWPP